MITGFLKKSPSLNLFMLLTSLLVAFILVELLLRVFMVKDFKPSHYLFFSKPALQDQETAFGFKENTDIREAAVYWNGKQFDIIYDTFLPRIISVWSRRNLLTPEKKPLFWLATALPKAAGRFPGFIH
jgi:hypothetical protein